MKKLIPLLLLLVAMPSLAQRQFDIEVIIFKRAVDAEKVSESWPNSLPAINVDNTGTFADNAYLEKKGATLLPVSDYQLNAQEQTLKDHAGFEVLLHTAWRQGDEGKSQAPIFHIQAGKNYADSFNPDGSARQPQDEPQIPVEGVVEQTMPAPIYELDGTLQVYVQHYLYAETTLDLKEPSTRDVVLKDKQLELEVSPDDQDANVQLGHLESVSPTQEVETFLKSYRMEQKRRMRSGETHYLDHPLMGMIIQVRRVDESAQTAQ